MKHYESIVREAVNIISAHENHLPSPFISVEGWRRCSFTYRLSREFVFIYFGAAGFFGNAVKFNDGVYETNSAYEATLYLVAHEMGHWATTVTADEMKHNDLWRDYYDRYATILFNEMKTPKDIEEKLLTEFSDYEKVRRKKLLEYVDYALIMENREDLRELIRQRPLTELDFQHRRIISKALVRHCNMWHISTEAFFVATGLLAGERRV